MTTPEDKIIEAVARAIVDTAKPNGLSEPWTMWTDEAKAAIQAYEQAKGENDMTHGFRTTKTAQGFEWAITRTEWNEAAGRSFTTELKAGVSATRAKALGAAKKWVLFFRRGGSI